MWEEGGETQLIKGEKRKQVSEGKSEPVAKIKPKNTWELIKKWESF